MPVAYLTDRSTTGRIFLSKWDVESEVEPQKLGKGRGEGKPTKAAFVIASLAFAINSILSSADCAMFAALTRLLNQAI